MSVFEVSRLLEQALDAIDDVPWEQEYEWRALQRVYRLVEKAYDGLGDLVARRVADKKEGT